jgi:DNA-binding XRE family transcriptional regulator
VIGSNLTRLRKERWFKQWQIAEKLGISRACYASYEEGRVDPTATIVWALCELYGITPNDIYGISEAKNLQA